MTEIIDVEVEDIEVKKQVNPIQPKVGSQDFCEVLFKEFSSGKVWRTSKALAEKLNVDVIELDAYMRTQQAVCSRPSKEEGVFLYALISKLDPPPAKQGIPTRQLVTEEDRYAFSSFHNALLLYESALQKYAIKIHEKNPEAFSLLMSGKNKLEAGLVLYGGVLKADITKLPKL